MTICSWVKVRETGTDKHGQMRQPIVMKGGLKEWEFALYVYDSLQPGFQYGVVKRVGVIRGVET